MNPNLETRCSRRGGGWAVAFVLAFMVASGRGQIAPDDGGAGAPDRIIVKFKTAGAPSVQGSAIQTLPAVSGPSEAERTEARLQVGASRIRRLRGDERSEVWQLSPGASLGDALARLKARDDVEYAEPDFRVSQCTEPNDPSFVDGTLWALRNTGQAGPDGSGVAGADINAPAGWDVRTDASSVIVAVIDSGIRRTHEDLAGNLWANGAEIPGNGVDDDGNGYIDDVQGINAITYTGSDSSCGDPNDDNGHGTHVAAIIGARGNNACGVAGVAWKVRLMACKFLDASGNGYISDAVECIDYARINGAKVMNNSWGGGGFSQALLEAIRRARDAGIVFVVAAGNNAANCDQVPIYPGSYAVDNIVTVAATDRRDLLAYYSNYGASAVLLGAPGDYVYSAYDLSDASYEYLSGTSMAAPYVSGALALMRAQFSGDSYARLVNRMLNSTRPVGALAGRTASGGVLNLQGALVCPNCAPRHNLRANAIAISTANGSANFGISGNNDGADLEPGEPANGSNAGGASVWYRFTVAQAGPITLTVTGTGVFRPILAVYAAGGGGFLSRQASVATGTTTGAVTFAPQVGRSYYVSVDGYDGATGAFDLLGRQPPANDDFANATVLRGTHGTLAQAAYGASREPGEPLPWGIYAGGASVWFAWTAPTTGSYTFGLVADGCSDNIVFDCYTGGSLDTLSRQPLAITRSPTGWDSTRSGLLGNYQVTLNATAGTTYYLQADVWTPGLGLGSLRLDWDVTPPNDEFASPQSLAGAGGQVTGDTRGATSVNGGFRPAYQVYGYGTKDVWFKWTCPRSGWVEFDTLTGTDWDTTIEVFTGSSEFDLRLVAANDDSGDARQSMVSYYAQAGTEYRIKLDGYTESVYSIGDTPAGPYALHWLQAPPCPNDLNGDGWPDLIWRNTGNGAVCGWLMDGATHVGSVDLGAAGLEWQLAGTGDFNGDGQPDLVWRHSASGAVFVWLMDGTAYGSQAYLGAAGTGWQLAAVADLNGDGQTDLLWRQASTGALYVWLMNGTTYVGQAYLGSASPDWQVIGTGDLNGDGQTDLLWRHTASGALFAWLMNGTTYAGQAYLGSAGAAWDLAATGDFNGDGQTDLVWRHAVTGATYVWLMDGTTYRDQAYLGIVDPVWQVVP